MSKTLVLLSALFLSLTVKATDIPIQTAPSTIRLTTLETTWSADAGHFLTTKYNERIERRLRFKATTTQSIGSPAFVSGDSSFSVDYTNCNTSVPTTYCVVDLVFNNTGKSNGTYTGTLTVGDLIINLTGAVSYSQLYKLTDTARINATGIELNTFQGMVSLVKANLYITDLNRGTMTLPTLSVTGSVFTATMGSCSLGVINSSGCQFEVTMPGNTAPGTYNETLTVAGISIPVSAVVQPIANRGASSNLVLMSSTGQIVSEYVFNSSDLGTGGNVYGYNIVDTNARATSSTTLSTSGSPFALYGVTGSCSAAELNASNWVASKCPVGISVSGQSSSGSRSGTLYSSINSASYPIKHETSTSARSVYPKIVFGDISGRENRVIKLPVRISGSGNETTSLRIRDLNKITNANDGTPVLTSSSSSGTSSIPGFGVLTLGGGTGTCVSTDLNSDQGCVVNLTFYNSSTNAASIGVYTTVITLRIGARDERVTVELEIQ